MHSFQASDPGKYIHLSVAYFTYCDIPPEKVPDQFSGVHVFYRRFLKFHSKKLVYQMKVILSGTAGEKTCVPDPGESFRQDMHQEPADELLCRKFHRLPCIVLPIIILIAEPDMLIIIRLDAVV